MNLHPATPQRRPTRGLLLACGLAFLFSAYVALVHAEQSKVDVLRIGTSGSLTTSSKDPNKEEAALDSLKSFIKEETGLANEIIKQKDWHELADKMANGQLHLGVFQGYEFAWAQPKSPELKPLAVAVNVYVYPVVYVVARNDGPAKDFSALQGQTLALPNTGQAFLRLFLAKLCNDSGKKPEAFFSKISAPDNSATAAGQLFFISPSL